jgi:copper chaperone CopZ
MTCGGCTSKVANALNAVPGVDDVSVSLSAGEATVHYKEGFTTPNQLRAAVQAAGYGAGVNTGAQIQPPKAGCCS